MYHKKMALNLKVDPTGNKIFAIDVNTTVKCTLLQRTQSFQSVEMEMLVTLKRKLCRKEVKTVRTESELSIGGRHCKYLA